MPDLFIENDNTLEDYHERVPRFVRWINGSAGTATIIFTNNVTPFLDGNGKAYGTSKNPISIAAGGNSGKLYVNAAAAPVGNGPTSFPYALTVSSLIRGK